MAGLPLILRPLRSDDEPFVFSSWLHAHAVNRDFRVKHETYYIEQHALIRELLSKDRVIVAADEKDNRLIFGWLAGVDLRFGRVLDYIFVKPVYRRMGVAKRLLADFGKVDAYSHFSVWAPRVAPGALYDPYTLYLPRRKGAVS